MTLPLNQTWNTKLYDKQHSFVAKYGLDLLELLKPKAGQNILDLGCGTGGLTAEIAKTGANVIGLDSSAEMIQKAKNSYPNIEFILGNATDFSFDHQFDAVFSNAVLHWIKEPQKVLQCVFKALKPKGIFVAEFGGKKNVETIINSLAQTIKELELKKEDPHTLNYFPDPKIYQTLLEKEGFKITDFSYFDRMTPLEEKDGLKNWVKMFCGYVLKDFSPKEEENFFNRVEEKARSILYKNNSWHADYKRIRFRAIKNG